jgi:hypothetical protein
LPSAFLLGCLDAIQSVLAVFFMYLFLVFLPSVILFSFRSTTAKRSYVEHFLTLKGRWLLPSPFLLGCWHDMQMVAGFLLHLPILHFFSWSYCSKSTRTTARDPMLDILSRECNMLNKFPRWHLSSAFLHAIQTCHGQLLPCIQLHPSTKY